MGWRQLSNVLWAVPILGLAPDEVSVGAAMRLRAHVAAHRLLGKG
jgi:hypothetical protein